MKAFLNVNNKIEIHNRIISLSDVLIFNLSLAK